MATSGTVDQTVFETAQVIDHAHRRCKMPPQLITAEKIDFALRSLWLFLTSQQNLGVPIWRIQTQLLPLYQGQGRVPTDAGTVEVLNANLRTMQELSGEATSSAGGTVANAFDDDVLTACTQTSANGNITIDYDTGVVLTTIGLLPNATGSWNFVYEVSQDGSTWVTVEAFTAQAVVDKQWLWRDYQITELPDYQYFRMRATGGTTLNIRELYVASTPSSIPIAPMNKDDYFNLPNKTFQGRPVQAWQDMERDLPVLRLWPIPNEAANFQLIEAQVHMQIQDVGSLTQVLDIPKRWYDATVWKLAAMIADEDVDVKADPAYVNGKADKALAEAWGGIAQKGPLILTPNISPYTR